MMENQKERYQIHAGKKWFVIDTDNDGLHEYGRVVAGPMDDDSAERAAHEMNDHSGNHRYLAAQKF